MKNFYLLLILISSLTSLYSFGTTSNKTPVVGTDSPTGWETFVIRSDQPSINAYWDDRTEFIAESSRYYFIFHLINANDDTVHWAIYRSATGGACNSPHSGTIPNCSPPSNEFTCSAGLQIMEVNGKQFCGSGGCDALVDYLASNYGSNADGGCANTNNPFNSSDSCGSENSTVCFSTADLDFQIDDNTSLDTPQTGSENGNILSPAADSVVDNGPTVTQGDISEDKTDYTYSNDSGDDVRESVTNNYDQSTNTNTQTTTTTTTDVQGNTTTTTSSEQTTGEPSTQDDTDDSTASGGGTCTSPPVSSGDPQLDAILFQTWSTRCALDSEITGAVDSCNFTATGGDAVQNAIAEATSREACENQTFAQSLEAEPDRFADDMNQGITDLETELGEPELDDDGSISGLEVDIDAADALDLSAVFNPSPITSDCPADKTMSLSLGGAQSFSYQPMCDVAERLNPLLLLIFSLIAARIMYRGLSESI